MSLHWFVDASRQWLLGPCARATPRQVDAGTRFQTGDFGAWNAEGELEVWGRKDAQAGIPTSEGAEARGRLIFFNLGPPRHIAGVFLWFPFKATNFGAPPNKEAPLVFVFVGCAR